MFYPTSLLQDSTNRMRNLHQITFLDFSFKNSSSWALENGAYCPSPRTECFSTVYKYTRLDYKIINFH